MAAKEYIINCSNLYMRVNGKIDLVPKGSKIKLEAKQAEKMLASGKILAPKAAKTVDGPKA